MNIIVSHVYIYQNKEHAWISKPKWRTVRVPVGLANIFFAIVRKQNVT